MKKPLLPTEKRGLYEQLGLRVITILRDYKIPLLLQTALEREVVGAALKLGFVLDPESTACKHKIAHSFRCQDCNAVVDWDPEHQCWRAL